MSETRRSKAVALAGVALLAALWAPSPAGALPATASGVLLGSGTLSPGLTVTPTYQNWTFNGTLAGPYAAGTAVAHLSHCAFSFTGTAETALAGGGSGSGVCRPPGPFDGGDYLGCSLNYTRSTTHISFSGSCAAFDDHVLVSQGPAVAQVEIVYTSANPATSYVLAGPMTFVGT